MLINTKSPHGGDIYFNTVRLDFSANLNPFGMPSAVSRALEEAIKQASAYPDPYCSELRSKIAATEDVSEDFILCGNGAAELIYQFAYALPKDKPALIVAPTFCEYEQALRAAGIATEYYMLRAEDGFCVTETILQTDFTRYGAVFLCSPNNPTGILAEPGIVRAIAESGVRLFCDFCFLDLTDTPKIYDIPAWVQTYPNLVVLRAFTKSYAMAGVRLGYVLCSDIAFLSVLSEKVQCWNVSTLAQAAGTAALSCGDWLRMSVQQISAERARMIAALRSLGVCVYPSKANFLLLYTDVPLAKRLMQRGIMVRDCANYVGLGQGYIRVAVRTAEENDQLLDAIKECL